MPGKSGISCNLCPNDKCENSYLRNTIGKCKYCKDEGFLVLEPKTKKKYGFVISCNKCKIRYSLALELDNFKILNSKCSEAGCGMSLLKFRVKKEEEKKK